MQDNRSNLSGKKVVIGLTGRIDSAVAAFLLKKQGLEVIGVTIVTVPNDFVDNEKFFPTCRVSHLEHVRDFCEGLGFRYYATDAKYLYENEVTDKIVANKLTGWSNASCFNCNKMRMRVLLEKMHQLKADFIATGHYAKINKNINSDEFFIHSNSDAHSDQSFLLGGVEQDCLKHLLLPLGELKKQEVEKIAKNFGLKVQGSKSTQSFCFEEKNSATKILKKMIPPSLVKEGQVIDINSGRVYGDHAGVIHHFMTESEMSIESGKPLEAHLQVVDYDFSKGVLYVGDEKYLTFEGFSLYDLSFSTSVDRGHPVVCYFKYKYSDKFIKGKIYYKNNRTALVELDEPLYPIIKDETIVFYDRNTRNAKIIGTGKVAERGKFKLVDRVALFRRENNDENKAKKEENEAQHSAKNMYRF